LSEPDDAFRRFLAHRVRVALSLINGPPQVGEAGGLRLAELREAVNDLGKLASKLSKQMHKSCNSGTSQDADWAFYYVVETWAQSLGRRYPNLAHAIEDDTERPDLAELDLFRDDFPERALVDMPPIFLSEFALATVASFANACEIVASSLRQGKGGAPKDTRFQELIAQLARAYQGFTGDRPTVTSDPIHYDYSGKFLSFLKASLHAFAPEYADRIDDPALGKTAQRILSKTIPKASDKSPQ
jgi:hypothetical protein